MLFDRAEVPLFITPKHFPQDRIIKPAIWQFVYTLPSAGIPAASPVILRVRRSGVK